MVRFFKILDFQAIIFLEFSSYTHQCLILSKEMSKCCHKIFIAFGIQTRVDKQNITLFTQYEWQGHLKTLSKFCLNEFLGSHPQICKLLWLMILESFLQIAVKFSINCGIK